MKSSFIKSNLLTLAKVTPKQCLGAILITDSKMQSASCVSVKCKSNNFRVPSCDSGDLRVVSYNSTSLWVATCELIIRLWVGSCISLHYIKSALWVYVISSLHVKQSKSNKVIWYISIVIYTWERKIHCDLNRNLNLLAIVIVPAPSLLPWLYVKTSGGGGLTSSGFYVESLPD